MVRSWHGVILRALLTVQFCCRIGLTITICSRRRYKTRMRSKSRCTICISRSIGRSCQVCFCFPLSVHSSRLIPCIQSIPESQRVSPRVKRSAINGPTSKHSSPKRSRVSSILCKSSSSTIQRPKAKSTRRRRTGTSYAGCTTTA